MEVRHSRQSGACGCSAPTVCSDCKPPADCSMCTLRFTCQQVGPLTGTPYGWYLSMQCQFWASSTSLQDSYAHINDVASCINHTRRLDVPLCCCCAVGFSNTTNCFARNLRVKNSGVFWGVDCQAHQAIMA
jgi:hypothetical protein